MRGVPLFSQEGYRLVNRGPAWREHPSYWTPDAPDEDDPWLDAMRGLEPDAIAPENLERP